MTELVEENDNRKDDQERQNIAESQRPDLLKCCDHQLPSALPERATMSVRSARHGLSPCNGEHTGKCLARPCEKRLPGASYSQLLSDPFAGETSPLSVQGERFSDTLRRT